MVWINLLISNSTTKLKLTNLWVYFLKKKFIVWICIKWLKKPIRCYKKPIRCYVKLIWWNYEMKHQSYIKILKTLKQKKVPKHVFLWNKKKTYVLAFLERWYGIMFSTWLIVCYRKDNVIWQLYFNIYSKYIHIPILIHVIWYYFYVLKTIFKIISGYISFCNKICFCAFRELNSE